MAEAIFLTQWKDAMYRMISMKYPDRKLNKDRVMSYLDKVIKDNIKNLNVSMINNYSNKIVKTDLLSVYDLIEKNGLIIGGGGTLYYPHSMKENILVDFIRHVMKERKYWKGERRKYEKGTDEWFKADLGQSGKKLVINSLYGAMGYPGFHLYNRFIAESITNQGRQIITTAISLVEQFLGDNVKFATISECFNFINNCMETYDLRKDEINLGLFDTVDFDDLYCKCENRMIDHCGFIVSESDKKNIHDIVYGLSKKRLVSLYYRNNLYEFTKLEPIKTLYQAIVPSTIKLELCEFSAIPDENCRASANLLNKLYELYVYYDFPTFDRVRKAMYTDKVNSLYTDTDSIFVSLYKLTRFIQNEIVQLEYERDQTEYDVTLMNLLLIFINHVIAKSLACLCKYMNVDKETAKALNMKNEFVFLRIMFITKKKRYISRAIYQEGELLANGEGLPEFKGFDFIKSTVKPYIREVYTDIAINDILKPEKINLVTIYRKMLALKNDIEESMARGESKYYKQSNVQVLEHYKRPYSSQGYVSVQVWNAVCPEHAIELPADVDIVPIIDLTYKKPSEGKVNQMLKDPREVNKNLAMISDKFPELYESLWKNIYSNPNPMIRHMSIRSMAKPKNNELVLPEWFESLINSEKVVNDAIGLFLPITNCLGIKSLHTTKSKEHLANIIAI